ncbi:F-box At2g27310 [Olea europaea subsp. europaea]|uniref:F-box At2g27310 n=1 Tax=Olea europaea subsp. europaea TaxID=158383 RepID=A0A8S0UY82_OLEEU|nr:F-box At2g27310 [Olea europaea subsp. europaea]
MSSCSTNTTAKTTDQGGGNTSIAAIHPDIIQSHILNRLDGQTLASTTCASKQLHSLCTEDNLWRDICNSTWPSTTDHRLRDAISDFPSGHLSFYSQSFPTLHHRCRPKKSHLLPKASELISAVDIYYDEKLIYSKVMVTETLSGWFLCSPFRLDLLDPKETVPVPVKFDVEEGDCRTLLEQRMRVSWILIDPIRKRAANVASMTSVETRRHWLTEDIQLRFAIVMPAGGGDLVQCGVVVTCGGKEGGDLQVREVTLQVEDMEGKVLNGSDILGILHEAMDGERKKSNRDIERESYEKFLKMKIQCRERNQRRERSLDMMCIATGVTIFFALCFLTLLR